MSRKPADIDPHAPIRWAEREEFATYFNSLPADRRWTHPHYPLQAMIWHWEECRWWALEEG